MLHRGPRPSAPKDGCHPAFAPCHDAADFVNTGQKRGGEAVWQLDSSNFDDMPASQRKKLAELPGPPLLGKHGLLNG